MTVGKAKGPAECCRISFRFGRTVFGSGLVSGIFLLSHGFPGPLGSVDSMLAITYLMGPLLATWVGEVTQPCSVGYIGFFDNHSFLRAEGHELGRRAVLKFQHA